MKPFLSACVLAAFLALFLSAPAAAFRKEAGITGDCTECHKLSKEEAGKMLGKIADNVVAVAPGPFPGVWEVDVARDGKTYPLYLDYSLKYLFTGQFIRLSDMANLTGLRFQDLNRVDVASIPVQDAIRVGSKAAKKTVIVLSDPTCPYCVKLHGEIRKAAAKDADVAFLVMPYPRNRNDKATYRNCLAVVCSKSEKAARRRLRREGTSRGRLQDRRGGRDDPARRAAEDRGDADDDPPRRAHGQRLQGGGGAPCARQVGHSSGNRRRNAGRRLGSAPLLLPVVPPGGVSAGVRHRISRRDPRQLHPVRLPGPPRDGRIHRKSHAGDPAAARFSCPRPTPSGWR